MKNSLALLLSLFLSMSSFAQASLGNLSESLKAGWQNAEKITITNQPQVQGEWVQLTRIGRNIDTHYTGVWNTTLKVTVGSVDIYSQDQSVPTISPYFLTRRGLIFSEVGNRNETRACRFSVTDEKLFCRISQDPVDIFEVYVRKIALPPLPPELPDAPPAPAVNTHGVPQSSHSNLLPLTIAPVMVPAATHEYPQVIPDPTRP